MNIPKLLTAKQVAQILQVSVRQVYALRDAEKLVVAAHRASDQLCGAMCIPSTSVVSIVDLQIDVSNADHGPG